MRLNGSGETFGRGWDKFDKLLLGDVPVARQALRKLISDRIIFTPVEGQRRYHLHWSYTVKTLLGEGYIGMASPRGFEPRLPP